MNLAVERQQTRNKIHPKKFALYAACASIVMMFGGFTSAYIVRQAQGNWLEFRLPDMIFYSTALILFSSVTLQLSYRSFLKGNVSMYRNLLVVTLLAGFGFIFMQYQGWLAMYDIGVELTRNPSGDFVYVISAVHAAHVIGGIAVLIVALAHAYLLKYKKTVQRKLRFELTMTYWHFVGLLWVYLLVFLLLNQS